ERAPIYAEVLIPRKANAMNARVPTKRIHRILASAIEPLETRTLLSVAALDPNFGSGGKTVTDFNGQPNSAYSVALANGKILVAVARYNADGTLDSTFGVNHDGKSSADFAHDFDRATAIAFQSGGKILITGSATVAFNSEFGMLRLTDSGLLDTTFGADHTGK